MCKILFIAIGICLLNISLYAQDIIVKLDGSTIMSKVLEVNYTDIKYKKNSNLQGPIYTIKKSDIQCINYENGDKDSFASINESTNKEADKKNFLIESKPSINNTHIVLSHNQDNHYNGKISKRKTSWLLELIHISSSSTLQNSDIQIEFAPPSPYIGVFKFKLTNLTDKRLYVDLGNCFRIYDNGEYETYYDNVVTAVSEGSNSSKGFGLNLGSVANILGIGGDLGVLASGTTIGGSKANSAMTTTITYQERYITIPPHGSYTIKENEFFYNDSKRLCIGEEVKFTEDNTPCKIRYIFTYSKCDDFKTYGTIDATLYVAKQIGVKKNFLRDDAHKFITGFDNNTLWDCTFED